MILVMHIGLIVDRDFKILAALRSKILAESNSGAEAAKTGANYDNFHCSFCEPSSREHYQILKQQNMNVKYGSYVDRRCLNDPLRGLSG